MKDGGPGWGGAADGPEGFLLEVDVEYPQVDVEYPHDAHDAYSPAPGRPEGVHVGLTKRLEANRGGEAGPEPPRQGALRAPLPQFTAVPSARDAPEKDSPATSAQTKLADGTMHPHEHRASEGDHERLQEGLYKLMNNSVLWRICRRESASSSYWPKTRLNLFPAQPSPGRTYSTTTWPPSGFTRIALC